MTRLIEKYQAFLINVLIQVRSSLPVLIIPYVILLGMLVGVWVISEQYDILIDIFFREPAATVGFHPFLGIMSHIGVLFWAFTVAVCFFAAILQLHKGSKRKGLFLLFASMLTFVLLADDFLLLHERIFPRYFNIKEKVIYMGYILAMLVFCAAFAKVILLTDYGFFLIACGFLALSIVADQVLPQTGIPILFEDGFKLFGIATWLIYFSRTSYQFTLELTVPEEIACEKTQLQE